MPSHHDYGVDHEHTAGGTPADEPACPVCGAPTMWVECYQVDCEDGYYHDCGEDCCCCLDPEPDTPCPACGGANGWWECTELPHTDEQVAAYRRRAGG